MAGWMRGWVMGLPAGEDRMIGLFTAHGVAGISRAVSWI